MSRRATIFWQFWAPKLNFQNVLHHNLSIRNFLFLLQVHNCRILAFREIREVHMRSFFTQKFHSYLKNLLCCIFFQNETFCFYCKSISSTVQKIIGRDGQTDSPTELRTLWIVEDFSILKIMPSLYSNNEPEFINQRCLKIF